jgi:TonB family protein
VSSTPHRNPIVGQVTGPDTGSLTTHKNPPSNLPVDVHATTIVTRKFDPGSVGKGPDIGAHVVSSRTRATTYGDGPPTSAVVVSRRGVPGGTGTGTDPSVPIGSRRTIAAATPPPTAGSLATGARPTFVPTPVYTADATAAKVQGNIVVRIRVLASGAVQVLGIQGAGLGHGLNEAALAVARGTKCKPALDANGHPIDSETIMTVHFQIAGL